MATPAGSAPPPAPTSAPTAAHYQALRRLRRMVLRSDHALLIYLWCDDPRTADWLRQQLDQALRARSRRVMHETVANDGGFRAALNTVLAPPSGCENFAVWVSLPVAAATSPLADHWLARVNERRLQLLQWPRAVIVCGPSGYEARAGEVAPDLWSVRSDSLALPAWVIADVPAAPLPASALAGPVASEPPATMLALWRAAWQSVDTGSPGEARRLDMGLGLSTAERLLQHRQLADAREVLDQLGTALASMPAPVDPTVLRQRLWQQQLLSDWFGLQGQWSTALAAAQAALASSEDLMQLTGESPESLRDWSVSLDNVGDVQRALGDVAGARTRYEDSLKLRERLVTLTGESPESLRDWSVSLDNVGDVQRALGDVAGARTRYEDSLKLRERLVKLTGESPESLRDWSLSLDNVGNVQQALGDVAGARTRYEDSLKVRERLVTLTGESPQSLRDQAVSFDRLGDLSLAQGDAGAARAYFERQLAAAQAALRQSPLSQDLQGVERTAQARLASLPTANP